MRIRILQFIVIFIVISACVQVIVNEKQVTALQNISISENIQEIQEVLKRVLIAISYSIKIYKNPIKFCCI